MISIEKGEVLKSLLTGKVFQVKLLTDQMVVLQSLDGETQVMTGKVSLKYFYEKLGPSPGVRAVNSPEAL